jgi:hypothetical protein
MEEILDIYEAPHDPDCPLICMDETSKQLLGHEREPLPMQPGRPLREDYHYERRGVQAIFLFFDPLRGWRRATARDGRTRIDWAEEVRTLLEVDYPQARRVILVCDNLNTHHIASLYTAFPPDHAHRLARRLDLHYTPRNGSWLNVAEIELSILTRQCLNRRIDSTDRLRTALAAWNQRRNASGSRVVWRFTTRNARAKLMRLYPHI